MTASLSASRQNLLIALESILGNEFFNHSIRNYGPGGVRLPDGRAIRYPITLPGENGETVKVRDGAVLKKTSDEILRSGYYAFGTNQLNVMSALDQVLTYLQKNHGLVIDG